MIHQPIDQQALVAQDPDGRLYNEDLRPAQPHERQWNMFVSDDALAG